jgi:Histidine kinase-, DNA gyrase B-, and HSP90-like ATPase
VKSTLTRAFLTSPIVTSNVLDWSRLEKGEAICRPVAVDIRLACEAIINLLPVRDEEVETDLLVVVAPKVPSSVFVDETYLHRIFMNLLSNAFKFTLSGYVLLLIEIKDDVLHATVKDTGFGIPQSFLPQLFEPFKQAQIRGAQRGTGLGLSIIKQLLQRMQGDITVESRYQQEDDVGPAKSGSTFSVTIPVSTLEDVPDSIIQEVVRPAQITIMHDSKDRDLEGLTTAWKTFGAEVIHAQEITAIPNNPDGIIWADLNFLKKHNTIRLQLLRQQQQMVLVPYDNQNLLDDTIGPSPARNLVPIRKPLVWHRIIRTISDARQRRHKPRPDKNVRFAQNVDVVEDAQEEIIPQSPIERKRTVLLVEDNKVGRSLCGNFTSR